MEMLTSKINDLKLKGAPVQVHLGCGKRYLPGFIHIDRDNYEHIDLHSCISNLSAFSEDSIDLIYSCHSLEYFDFKEIPAVLKEWARALKKGGTLRISVPDFDKVVLIYQKTRDLKLLYGFLYGRYQASNGTTSPLIYHKMTFNFESLSSFLEEAGFEDIRRYDWQQTIHKDYDDYSQAYLPHMDKENGIMMSLNIEATKA